MVVVLWAGKLDGGNAFLGGGIDAETLLARTSPLAVVEGSEVVLLEAQRCEEVVLCKGESGHLSNNYKVLRLIVSSRIQTSKVTARTVVVRFILVATNC